MSGDKPDGTKRISGVRPKFATISGFCGLTGLGRTQVYQLLAANRLRGKKVGKRMIIDVDHGLDFIESLPDAQIILPNSRRQVPQPQR